MVAAWGTVGGVASNIVGEWYPSGGVIILELDDFFKRPSVGVCGVQRTPADEVSIKKRPIQCITRCAHVRGGALSKRGVLSSVICSTQHE